MPGAYDDLIPSDATLSAVKQRESGGKNLPPTANYDYPRSHASGLYQIQPGTWKDWTKNTGIGQEYPEAYQAPSVVQTANAKFAEKKYGPNAPYTWAASAPKGGYPVSKQTKGGYDDLIPKQQKKGAYDDLIPKVSPDILAKARSGNTPFGPNRPPGSVDPSIAARQKAAQPQSTSIGEAAGAEAQAMMGAPGKQSMELPEAALIAAPMSMTRGVVETVKGLPQL